MIARRKFARHAGTGRAGRAGRVSIECLSDALEHWSIGRLSRVDHNILRLAVYELLRMEDIPARVTIDEAIELAKTYGDQESGRFVNGVLDHVAGQRKLKDKGDENHPAKPSQA